MKKLISLALIIAFASSCSHVPMNEKQPVQFVHRFWEGPGFAQDGLFLDQSDAEAKISKVPAAAEKLTSAHHWQLGGLAVDVAGLVVALTAPRQDNGTLSGQYWTGLGIILIGTIPFFVMSNKRLEEAADAFNGARFTSTPKTSMYLAPVKDGGLAGVKLDF